MIPCLSSRGRTNYRTGQPGLAVPECTRDGTASDPRQCAKTSVAGFFRGHE